jgi:hypothetical protein
MLLGFIGFIGWGETETITSSAFRLTRLVGGFACGASCHLTGSSTISSELPFAHTPAFTDVGLRITVPTGIHIHGPGSFLCTQSDLMSKQYSPNGSAVTDCVSDRDSGLSSDFTIPGTVPMSFTVDLLIPSESSLHHCAVMNSGFTRLNSHTLPESGEVRLVNVRPSNPTVLRDSPILRGFLPWITLLPLYSHSLRSDQQCVDWSAHILQDMESNISCEYTASNVPFASADVLLSFVHCTIVGGTVTPVPLPVHIACTYRQ